jgi:hypothetical protein
LRDIFGVGILQSPLPTPAADVTAVLFDELVSGCVI